MKSIFFGCLVFCAANLSAQVGIGTSVPDNSAMLDVTATDKGMLFPRLTTAQRIAISTPASGLHVFDISTNSLWFFNGNHWINYAAQAKFGDVKSGVQIQDHEGWVLLDGRAINTLSSTQQSVAISFGFAVNIPNAENAYLVKDASPIGSVNGLNTVQLAQSNLPAVSFTGTAATSGNHSHLVDPAAVNTTSVGAHSHATSSQSLTTSQYTHNHGVGDGSNAYNEVGQNVPGLVRKTMSGEALTACCLDVMFSGEEPDLRFSPRAIPNDSHTHTVTVPAMQTTESGAHSHSVDIPSTTSSSNGDHTHTVSVSSGGTGAAINIKPRSLTVNMFIYLGL
jgi:hypothetical protein